MYGMRGAGRGLGFGWVRRSSEPAGRQRYGGNGNGGGRLRLFGADYYLAVGYVLVV